MPDPLRDLVDVHIHVVDPEIPGAKSTPGDDPLDLPLDELADTLKHELASAGVSIALAMGRLDGPRDDALGVNGTLRLARLVPGLRAIGIADPRKTPAANPEHFAVAERQLASGKVVALKAYLGYVPVGPDDPGYRPYYRLAARYKVPVVFHTGDTWSTTAKVRFAQPLRVDDVAVDHPDVQFVLAHFGNPWMMDAAEVVFKNDNVWADLSGLIVGDESSFQTDPQGHPAPETVWASWEPDFRKAYRYADKPERFLYGTDWPLAAMADYRKFIAAIIPPDHHAAVFRDNARALFGLK